MSLKISSICLKFSPALLFLLFFQFSQAQGSKKLVKELGVAEYSALNDVVQRNAKALGNDASVLLWTDTLVYKKELGSFDSKTLVPLESASKWLTAALVLKLAEEGKISLDDKVSQYLPVFESYGKTYITIRHCLTHFTGIQMDGGGIFSKKKYGSLEDEVEAYAKREIQTNPGTEFRYTQAGFAIAGRILEVVSKKKFDMLIKQKLFNPLGMRKSTFSKLDGSAIDPSSGGQSTADEFMNFLQMLLNNGTFKGQAFLSEASVAELKKISAASSAIKTPVKGAEGLGYAAGSWVLDEKGSGEAGAVASPGMPGVLPLVDWCRGYALLVLPKSDVELRKDLLLQFKAAADEKRPSKCK